MGRWRSYGTRRGSGCGPATSRRTWGPPRTWTSLSSRCRLRSRTRSSTGSWTSSKERWRRTRCTGTGGAATAPSWWAPDTRVPCSCPPREPCTRSSAGSAAPPGSPTSSDGDRLAQRRPPLDATLREPGSLHGRGQKAGPTSNAPRERFRGGRAGGPPQPRRPRQGGVRVFVRPLPALAEDARAQARPRRLQRKPHRVRDTGGKGVRGGRGVGLKVRVIPCLDVDAGRVVKGTKFKNLRDAGDPVELAALYDRE